MDQLAQGGTRQGTGNEIILGQDLGQGLGQDLGQTMGQDLGQDKGQLGHGTKNNFGTKFFNFLLLGQSLRDYNLSLPARSRSSGAKNEGVMPFFSSGAFQ